MKRSYLSGSNKRKKQKDAEKYIATLPKLTNFLTLLLGIQTGTTSTEYAATAVAASCELSDRVDNFDTYQVEELSNDGLHPNEKAGEV